MSGKAIHEGRNVKRIREILGVKQDALAIELGLSQQAVSQLEQKEKIDNKILDDVAKALKVPVEAIKNFNEEAAVNYINTFYDGSINNGAFSPEFNNCTFNPVEKIVELYDALIKEKDSKIELLEGLLKNK
jgi:transcriptional regulator with XRE-family HTH domain